MNSDKLQRGSWKRTDLYIWKRSARYVQSDVSIWQLRHFAIPFLIFTGGGCKKSEIWLRFSAPVLLESPTFGNGAMYVKYKTKSKAPMIYLCPVKIWYSSICISEKNGVTILPPKKLATAWSVLNCYNNSAMHCPILLKFDTLLHIWVVAELTYTKWISISTVWGRGCTN